MATLDDIKRVNREAGQFWFSRDTLRFFDRRIESDLIADSYFVTSEKGPHQSRRLYTVREVVDGGRDIVSAAKGFQAYPNRAAAIYAANLLVQGRSDLVQED